MIIDGRRALAYTARCGQIEKIEGADNIELMSVLGWKVIAKIGEFHEGDLCVYFEIDSKLPEKEWSEFMAPKHSSKAPYTLQRLMYTNLFWQSREFLANRIHIAIKCSSLKVRSIAPQVIA